MTDASKAQDDGDADQPIAYADAMAELEEILGQLEGTDVDVDILADQVHRATELISHCRDRISQARLEVEDAVASLETTTSPDSNDEQQAGSEDDADNADGADEADAAQE